MVGFGQFLNKTLVFKMVLILKDCEMDATTDAEAYGR